MKNISVSILLVLVSTLAFSQDNTQSESISFEIVEQEDFRRHSIGSSIFMAFNFSEDSADFYQLSYGYRITEKDNFIVEAITWKYGEPLGTYGSSEDMFPGIVRSFGIGVGYQRFLWRNLYASVVVTPFFQQYHDEANKQIQNGFMLYFQYIIGYRFEFFKKRFYVEPAYALKYWPVNTNLPQSYKDIERGTPKYKFEPSLSFGFRF
jgi:hypothetical protein